MSFNFSQNEFDAEIKKHGSTVLFKKIAADTITPVLASIKIAKHFPNHHFLFESAENGNNKGRYSLLGFMPDLMWKSSGEQSFINEDFANNPRNFTPEEGNPLQNLRQLISKSRIDWENLKYNSDTLPAMGSGIFGYMGYDMFRLMEKIPDKNLEDELQIPDSVFIRPQIVIIFDDLFDCALICAPVFSAQNYEDVVMRISGAERILSNTHDFSSTQVETEFNFTSNCSESEYCEMVEKAKKYITDGDIFQVLPSQRFTANFSNHLPTFSFYRALRSVNPSPFLFYLKLDDFVLSGSSPEIMASLKDSKVTIRPLAGTRKRGANSAEDKKIADELLKDEKEVAEHLMLIDLGRHDVGRVSKAGSVKVTEKMAIENYSHVMHISSNVEGILNDGLDALDVLISGFPAGTVSGAPKIRAIEIIEEIEKVRRSFYAGCVGYFASNGNMETCITLRSALIKNEKIYLQAGAGVVFDSDPKSEYQECLNKAMGLVRACEKIKEFV
jgi:anthranilate synthase component I